MNHCSERIKICIYIVDDSYLNRSNLISAFTPTLYSCSLTGNPNNRGETFEFVYLSRPSCDSDGNCSFSVQAHSYAIDDEIVIGFGINDTLSRTSNLKDNVWNNVIAINLFGDITMKRAIRDSTLTLTYNERKGTLHGFYDMEPSIRLQYDIPRSVPFQPFIGMRINNTNRASVIIVNTVRQVKNVVPAAAARYIGALFLFLLLYY